MAPVLPPPSLPDETPPTLTLLPTLCLLLFTSIPFPMATIREQHQAHERRELIRSIILRICHAARVGGNSLGVSLGLIERGLQRDGLNILLEEIEAEVVYLAGKGWIEPVRKENTPAARRWRVTASGVDQAESEGF